MSPKQVRNPDVTKTELLEAAEALFLKKGFGNTSLSEIAKRAGITKSLIHHYFGSKEGIWSEVKNRRFAQYAERQSVMLSEEEPNVELLRASLVLYFHFLKRNPEIVRILAWIFLEQDRDGCMKEQRELTIEGVEKIRQGQELGHLRKDVDPRFILFTFLGLCQHWFQDKDHFIRDFGTEGISEDLDNAYLDALIKIFFGGVLNTT